MKGEHYNNLTDQELLEQFYADHNNEWLGILLQRYTLLLLGVSMKYLKNESLEIAQHYANIVVDFLNTPENYTKFESYINLGQPLF